MKNIFNLLFLALYWILAILNLYWLYEAKTELQALKYGIPFLAFILLAIKQEKQCE